MSPYVSAAVLGLIIVIGLVCFYVGRREQGWTEECNVCGKDVPESKVHRIYSDGLDAALKKDLEDNGPGGGLDEIANHTFMIAEFCKDCCPGGCTKGEPKKVEQ